MKLFRNEHSINHKMEIHLGKITISIEVEIIRYYEIIGNYFGNVIGWTCDKEGVLEDEPNVTFRQISRREWEQRHEKKGY
jgi:hypothetical protein